MSRSRRTDLATAADDYQASSVTPPARPLRAAGAVVDVEVAVVAPRDHPIADGDVQATHRDGIAQLASLLPPRVRVVIERGPGVVVAADHHRLLDPHRLHVGLPGGHGRLLGRLGAAVVNDKLATIVL